MAILVQTFRSIGGVASSTIAEGRAVKITQSGTRGDLPVVTYASANDVTGVYVAFFPPDNFARPTPASMYTAPYYTNYRAGSDSVYGNPVDTDDMYRIPRSMWNAPSVYSGELVALHAGRVGIQDGAFHDSAAIRVPGSWVRVGASGMWQTTSTQAEVVGYVERYDVDNGVLYVTLNV